MAVIFLREPSTLVSIRTRMVRREFSRSFVHLYCHSGFELTEYLIVSLTITHQASSIVHPHIIYQWLTDDKLLPNLM